MSDETMYGGLDAAQAERLRAEAAHKWGAALVDESHRRLGSLSPDRRNQVWAESGQIERDAAALMDRSPDDQAVQAVIARWYQLIDTAFYALEPDVFRGLGDTYVADHRFAAHYEAVRPGLAVFMRAAMHIFCDQLEGREGQA